jgi:hypothetical protein
MDKTESKKRTIKIPKTLDEKLDSRAKFRKEELKYKVPPKKYLVNISVELLDPHSKGELIKTALPRILREFALIEESPEGARHEVEKYTDKYGNTLKSIVSTDYGFEIPYIE